MSKKIGLSLSFCVRDIAEGKIPLSDVEKIISSTKAENERDWAEVAKRYLQVYWRDNPQECHKIFKTLLQEGKIVQPRLEGKQGPNISEGHWKDSQGIENTIYK